MRSVQFPNTIAAINSIAIRIAILYQPAIRIAILYQPAILTISIILVILTRQTARDPARAYRTVCFPCVFEDRQQQRQLLEEDGAFASSGDEGNPHVVVNAVIGDLETGLILEDDEQDECH